MSELRNPFVKGNRVQSHFGFSCTPLLNGSALSGSSPLPHITGTPFLPCRQSPFALPLRFSLSMYTLNARQPRPRCSTAALKNNGDSCVENAPLPPSTMGRAARRYLHAHLQGPPPPQQRQETTFQRTACTVSCNFRSEREGPRRKPKRDVTPFFPQHTKWLRETSFKKGSLAEGQSCFYFFCGPFFAPSGWSRGSTQVLLLDSLFGCSPFIARPIWLHVSRTASVSVFPLTGKL